MIVPESVRRRSSTGRAIYIGYIFLLCQPYIHWLGRGTPTDVQVYPLLLATPFLLHHLASNKIMARDHAAVRQRDPLLLGLVVAAVPIAALQMLGDHSSAFATVRGLFGYVSIGTLTWAWVWVIRNAGPELTIKGLKVTFWIWAAVGATQLVKPTFGTFWRDKLILTQGRGALSFATEPAYFAFALLLLALAIGMLTRTSRYLILSTVVIALVARSSVGIVYCLVAALVIAQVSIGRKIALLGGVTGLWYAAVHLFPTARIGTASVALISHPYALIASDKSTGLRYINVVYPIQGLVQNHGLPHGLTAWPLFQYDQFMASTRYYTWGISYDPNSSGGILSIHGQLLFELGIFALVYYVLFWKIIRRAERPVGLAIIGMALFFNGVTLNSPFLALVLATAYMQREIPRVEPTPRKPRGGRRGRQPRRNDRDDRMRRDYLRSTIRM